MTKSSQSAAVRVQRVVIWETRESQLSMKTTGKAPVAPSNSDLADTAEVLNISSVKFPLSRHAGKKTTTNGLSNHGGLREVGGIIDIYSLHPPRKYHSSQIPSVRGVRAMRKSQNLGRRDV